MALLSQNKRCTFYFGECTRSHLVHHLYFLFSDTYFLLFTSYFLAQHIRIGGNWFNTGEAVGER